MSVGKRAAPRLFAVSKITMSSVLLNRLLAWTLCFQLTDSPTVSTAGSKMDDDLFAAFGSKATPAEAKPAATTLASKEEVAEVSSDKEKKGKKRQKRDKSGKKSRNGSQSPEGASAGEVGATSVKKAVLSQGAAQAKEEDDDDDEEEDEETPRKRVKTDAEGAKSNGSSPAQPAEQAEEKKASNGSGRQRKPVNIEMAKPMADEPIVADSFEEEAHTSVAASGGLLPSASTSEATTGEAGGKITLSHQVRHQVAIPPGYAYVPLSQHVAPAKPARTYPFELDPFQKVSVASIERNESVLVSAHTSAGKTVVAEYAIAQCLREKQRVIYTSPIKVGSC